MINFKNKVNFISYKNSSGNFCSGFTVIETLVAISILLLCVVGPMEIAAKSLNSAYYAKDQITAYYLAQEGIEKIRNIRDQIYLNNSSSGTTYEWIDSGNLNICFETNGCDIDVTADIANPNIITCDPKNATGNACQLNYDATSGFYSHNPSDPSSKFTRIIKIEKITNIEVLSDQENPNSERIPLKEQVLITSTILWNVGFLGTTKEFTISESLLNWPQPLGNFQINETTPNP